MTAGADVQIVFRRGKIEFREEDPVELLGVMLFRMNDEVVELPVLAFANDRRHFYDFRASSDENGDFHVFSMSGSNMRTWYGCVTNWLPRLKSCLRSAARRSD